MEPRQEGARLPVLRHHFARAGRTHRHRRGSHRRARSGRGVARHSRRATRLAGGKDLRQMPELPGHFRLRPRARRPALRFLRLDRARALRGNQGSVPPGKPAADEGQREPGARRHPPMVRQPLVRAQQTQDAPRSPTPSRAFTFPTGPSTPRSTPIGPPRAAITITRPKLTPTPTGKQQTRQVQKIRWEPSSGVARPFLRRRTGARLARRATGDVAAGSSRSRPPRNWCPTSRAFFPAGSWSGIKLISSPPPRQAREEMDAEDRSPVRRPGARRHASQSAGGRRIIPARPSSTSSCRSGC